MKETKVILITMLINMAVAIIKLVSGLFFSFSTLIADSVQSFTDTLTDVTSLVAYKIGKKRANKTYPFGYGQVDYLSNLFTGILLFLIGVFIIVRAFVVEDNFKPNLIILVILLVALILKLMVIFLLKYYGKISKNELLVESYKESRADFISTCVVIVVLLISLIEDYIPSFINVDTIGSICMALYIMFTASKIIISNTRGIMINDVANDDIKKEITNELKRYKSLRFTKIKVIKISNYYSVFLQIDMNNNSKIKDYLRIEKKIKKHLKSTNRLIRFIDIEPI